ncbi:hypothetical protein [Swaminathania salitolerans]|uniref:Uncharacterized protein n=1 Tax=Swaminathania salitolerans TaxID=182838 RepID=A0A511BQH7_9PROT|nr:hypothetical protein [Swaminathania salitolerans]GBQ11712.1 hypothetical protein AA21291_0936 [Swaminathania salitolerans LMG 21291]GEL02596.1 hypothetical protein SSA02_17590 [Swaminathania salitolerans]
MSARMQVIQKEDGSGATLRFLEGSGLEGEIDLTLGQLSQLIASLGRVRFALTNNQPQPPIGNAPFLPVYSTNWALQIDALTEGSTLAFQHPAFGPVGVVFPPGDVETLIKGLKQHRALMAANTSRKPS